jgi:four helix bundle protein
MNEENGMNTVVHKPADLQQRLVEFAVRVIVVGTALPANKVGAHIASQIVRTGTSPAANYAEAQSAESRADFIHKMKICLKELRETHVWLQIIASAALIKPASKLALLLDECNQLIAIFVSCINTARRKTSAA